MGGYLELLSARTRAVGSVLCLGVDPDPATIPGSFGSGLAGLERFTALLVEAALPYAAAVKPNVAFFEAFGSAGLASLERLLGRLPGDVPIVADVKRGDIGTTATRHAAAIFDGLGAHALTASPYLGAEAITPLLEREDRFVYVLCRTSNPGAGELQNLVVAADPDGRRPSEPLYERVAALAAGWQARHGTVGLVVGATAPAELRAVRAIAPTLPFLVPGIGWQGGDLTAAMADGPVRDGPIATTPGGGLLLNVSRGIAGAATGAGEPGEAMAAAALEWARRTSVLP
ncbi:MAG: orotidine-5'-phosphate decarboxylase [Candidatus Limnocylindrales bacterium]